MLDSLKNRAIEVPTSRTLPPVTVQAGLQLGDYPARSHRRRGTLGDIAFSPYRRSSAYFSLP